VRQSRDVCCHGAAVCMTTLQAMMQNPHLARAWRISQSLEQRRTGWKPVPRTTLSSNRFAITCDLLSDLLK